MTKQFDLDLISTVTIVEKNSELPLKYKKIVHTIFEDSIEEDSEIDVEEETTVRQVLQKIVVGLPMGKRASEWETLKVRPVHIFTNTRPFEKKYPVMLEYSEKDTHIAYFADIDDKTYVVVSRDGEVLLVETSDSMVPQDAVFTKSSKLTPLHADGKFLYWTVDNEFKLLDKDSIDMQVLGAEFFNKAYDTPSAFASTSTSPETPDNFLEKFLLENRECDKTPLVKLQQQPIPSTMCCDPTKCFPQPTQKSKSPPTVVSKQSQKEMEDATASAFFFFLLLCLIAISVVLSFDGTMAIVSSALVFLFIALAKF